MAEISATLVKELREKTGAGMMDCKKALAESTGNLEQAIDWLRKKGLSAASKKAGRIASEGLIATAAVDGKGAVVEVNSETDFVSRNETFQGFARTVAGIALTEGGDIEKLRQANFPGTGRNVADELTHLVATIGENMNLRRSAVLSVSPGVVAAYVHSALTPDLGKIGVLIALESTADKTRLADLGKKLAMHIAATRPDCVSIADVDPTNLARERDVLAEQARASGKPEAIIEKMVEGRLRKYYEEVCLLEQIFVIDGETKVAQVIEKAAKDLGTPIKINGFARFALGEGIEKEQKDFATEVAETLKR
ncbi:MAG: translation elongation factor Ts [Alphaproteobacteria bacterium]